MLEVATWPQLREPMLVVALQGWVDAGMAGEQAVGILRSQSPAARRFARIDLADLVDLQQTRPGIAIEGGTTRRIVWPEIEIVAGSVGRDLVLVTGPEPSLRWPSMVAGLVDLAVRLDVVVAYGLGAMPTVTTHRRSVEVLATATDASLAEQVGALRTDYAGITGLQTALLVALGEAGIPGVGLWAQVPHYLAGSPSPPAARALLDRLARLAGVTVDLDPLDGALAEYLDSVEANLADRPEVAGFVEAIEAQLPPEGADDDLIGEIERYLRSRPDPD
jgi:proteasome assembly chaperone (PAC2) family protein